MESCQTKTRAIFDIDEVLIIKEESHCEYNSKSKEETECRSMDNSNEDENFPWLDEFTSLMSSAIRNTSYALLEYLLTTYEKNLSRDFSRCSLKPLKSTKLKKHIKNTLNFFHFYWQNVRKEVSDHNSFLNKMTEIVRMYLDLEVQTSSEDIDSANILTALYIYLDNSEEHMFKILLKNRYETETSKRIYCPVFAKLLSNTKSSVESITKFSYARYLLAFELWKMIVDSQDEKVKITTMALMKLGLSVPEMDSELSNFIPNPPEGHESGTLWLMSCSLIDLQKACDGFLMLEAKLHSSSCSDELKNSQFDEEKYLQFKSHFGINRISKKKPVKKKVKRSLPKMKPGEVLFIDLTSENEEAKQIKSKKQKIKKKPQWLKDIKIHHKLKKPQRTKWIEIAEAHSTDMCESFEETHSESALFSETTFDSNQSSVCCPIEENIVFSQNTENNTNQKTLTEANLTNVCQKCDVTSNTTENETNNETNPDFVNSNNILLDDSKQDRSNNSRQDIVNSSTSYVTPVCDNQAQKRWAQRLRLSRQVAELGLPPLAPPRERRIQITIPALLATPTTKLPTPQELFRPIHI